LIRRGLRKLKPHRLTFPTARQLVSEAGVVFIALLLALATWTFVIQETNPAQQVRLENIPLIIKDMPANSTLMAAPPANVSAIIQTTASVRPTLGSRSLEAAVSLKDVSPGLHSLPITVRSNVPLVQVISVDPPVLDLEMAAIISRTVEVAVEMVEQQNLSRAYQVVGAPQAQPAAVEIMGPEPLVQRVSKAQAGLSLANASSSLREVRPLVALDESGAEVSGVTFRPAMVQVSLTIRRRINARDVGVRVVTQGAPPSGYWLSNISVTPGSVTLQGNPDILDQVGGYIDTLPVDVSSSTGNVSLQMPLELPPDLQVVDSNGQPANTVTVQLGISARQGNLSITRPVKLIGSNSDLAVSVTPATVSLILSGPLPTLSQIASDPSLVQVLVAVAGLEPGLNSAVTPTIIAPDEVKAQAVPPTVAVILPQNGNSSPPEVSKR
jgi:YbbR domain-containing protein